MEPCRAFQWDSAADAKIPKDMEKKKMTCMRRLLSFGTAVVLLFACARQLDEPMLVNISPGQNVTLPGNFGGRAYHESLLYENSTFIGERDGSNNLTGAYSFVFYRLENKHQGLPFTAGFSADEVKPSVEGHRETSISAV